MNGNQGFKTSKKKPKWVWFYVGSENELEPLNVKNLLWNCIADKIKGAAFYNHCKNLNAA